MAGRDCVDCAIVTHPECPHCHELIAKMPKDVKTLLSTVGIRVANVEAEPWLIDYIRQVNIDRAGFVHLSAPTPTLICIAPDGRVLYKRVLGSPPPQDAERFWTSVKIIFMSLSHLPTCWRKRGRKKKEEEKK